MTVTRTLRLWIAMAAIAGATGFQALPSAAQQAASQLFERARMLEETGTRNLSEAIAAYQEVAGRRNENPALAAQAQLRIGLLYERLGRSADARRAFENVVSQHVSQGNVVTEARARLQAMSSPAAAAGVSGPQLVRRFDSQASEFSLSPDRRTLAMYRLALLDLASGATSHLSPGFTTPQCCYAGNGRWEDAEWPVVSHDGKQVAYEWFVFDGKAWSSELRVIPTSAGGKPTVLINRPEFGYFTPVGWSNDGKAILTTIDRNSEKPVLAWVSASDGAVTTVESLDGRQNGRPSLSPSGRYIAYSAFTSDPGNTRGPARRQLEARIYLVRADGTGRIELSTTAGASDSSPAWADDESAVYFASNRLGTVGLWTAPVKDGRPVGPVALVRGGTGDIELLGTTRTGTLYYHSVADTQTVTIRSTSSQGAGTQTVLNGSSMSWSPDGRSIAYLPADGNTALRLVVHSVQTGEEQSFARSGLRIMQPRWFKDGRRVLVAVADKPGEAASAAVQNALYILDRQTGTWTLALPADPRRIVAYVGPDDHIYSAEGEAATPSTPSVVTRVDVTTGARTRVFDFAVLPKGVGFGNLSPDGSRWAVAGEVGTEFCIFTVALDGSGVKEVHRAPASTSNNYSGGMRWSGDSRTIYWTERRSAADGSSSKIRILRVAAAGGPVQFSGMEVDDDAFVTYLQLSPDGTRVAALQTRREPEIWSLNLQALKGGR